MSAKTLTPAPAKSLAPAVFASEIEGFTAASRLSRRESDIVMALIKNITNSEDIAKSLGISTHTVNNHLKSIFEKTSTKSKTEILSTFLQFAADKAQMRGLFMRRPRVLFVDDEEMICEMVVGGLRDRGARAFSVSNPADVVAQISSHHIDFVVCDIRMPGMNGMEVLKAVRKAYPVWPYFIFVTGYPDYSLEECMDAGAVGFIEKPLDVDKLFRTIMTYLVESPDERLDLLELRGAEPVQIDEPIAVTRAELGFGGAFLPAETWAQKKPRLGVGALVDFALNPSQAGGSPLHVRGHVVWKRANKEQGRKPGIGVRFLNMSDADQERYEAYLNEVPNKSFIPLGDASGEAGA